MTITTLNVSFNAAGYSNYEILAGSLTSSGNPGSCVDGGFGNVTSAQVKVLLPTPATVTAVSLDWWKYHPFPFNLLRYVGLYDEDDNLLAEPINSYTTVTTDVWNTIDASGLSVSNVAYAIFWVGASLASNLQGKLDNCSITFTPDGPAEPLNPGTEDCPIATAGESSVGNPIGIRHGEKREEVVDLSLNTPAGALTLTRTYSQNKQDEFQFMGLGWNHNHLYKLTLINGTPDTIIVRLSNGGEAHFTETSTNHFEGVAGVNSFIDWDSGSSQYTLTASDRSTFVFDSSGNLVTRTWPNGEIWNYSYSSGRLAEVNDNYEESSVKIRKLVFRYYSSGSHSGQLYRVGDQTFDDTNPSSPTGRYVEYGYTLNKVVDSSGAIVNGSNSLLTSVRDVRGNVWTYDYYGQDSAETDVRQLNFLIERLSPSVDTTGDGAADGALSLEDVSYTIQGTELAVNGSMEADSSWSDVSSPTTNVRSTGQVDSGTYSRHVVASSAGQGIEGTSWNLSANKTYIVSARVYPVSGTVKMQVTNETDFDRTSSGTGSWQLLRAVYIPTSNATGRKLQFVASGGAAEFYVDSVSILESDLSVTAIQQARGDGALVTDYAFQPSGQNITTETIAGETAIHRFFNGVYGGTEDPQGNFGFQAQNTNYRPVLQQDANGNQTFLTWSSDGKHLTKIVNALGDETNLSYDASDRLQSSTDPEDRQTAHFYDADLREPGLTTVASSASEIAINGDMEDTSGWNDVNSPTTNVRSTTQVDTGTYSRHVEASAANQGIESAAWNWVVDHTYFIVARVYPVSGTVKMQVTGTSEFDQTSTGTGSWQTLRALYTPTSGATGKKLQFIASGGAAEFYVDSVHILDAIDLLRLRELRYDDKVRNVLDAMLDPKTGAVLRQAIRSYYASGVGNGLLETVILHEPPALTNYASITFTYDSAGRVVKTQQSSLFGSCEVSYNVYDAASNVVASICDYDNLGSAPMTAAAAVGLYNPLLPEKNRVTTHEYDTLGRRVSTTVNAGASFAQTTLTVYDALHRVIRTIANYVEDVSITEPYIAARSVFDHGVGNTENLVTDAVYNERGMLRKQIDALGNAALFGYDDADRLVKTVVNASDPDYNNDYSGAGSNPDLNGYTPSIAADEDIITVYDYDPTGNLVMTTDSLGNASFIVYDALNRPIKTVRSADDNATVSLDPGDMGYSAANDPRSAGYSVSTDPDRDLIETMEYDAIGRVIRTQRLIENRGGATTWDTTLLGYDPLGRQVKTVRSASQPTYNVGNDPDLSSYTPSGNADEDIVTTQQYDTFDNLTKLVDLFGTASFTVFDTLNQPIKTVYSAHQNATIDLNPGQGGYSAANDPRSGSYSVSGGADTDLIIDTFFNGDGRVYRTTDVLGRDTLIGYDAQGRIVRTIKNASDPTPSVPADLSGYSPVSDSDQDVITDMVYDDQWRLFKTIDTRGNETRFEYDALGQLTQTIINYDDGVYDPDYPDEDLISTATYDLAGRVVISVDPAGIETRFEYDALGRIVETIRNYVDGVFSSAAPDEDVIEAVTYNRGGQVVATTDARGTQTTITYDAVGRPRTFTRAANTPLASTDYTAYDKGGRVLRLVENWIDDPGQPTPDEQDGSGDWLFNPTPHQQGRYRDRNLVLNFSYDKLGRLIQTADPLGHANTTTYFKDGLVESVTDPLGVVMQYRYDRVRRLNRVIENYVSNGEDPALWVWDDAIGQKRWEKSGGTAIAHGSNSDQNIIVDVTYNKAGRVTSQRDPRGSLTAYDYDLLDRRTELTNPLSETWATAYEDLMGGGLRVTLTDPNAVDTQGVFDRVGRLASIAYDSPSTTPDVTFGYNAAGVRTKMSEWSGAGFTSRIRETTYSYDDLRRLTSIGFDSDGNGSANESVSYEYDAGGLRTQLTLPGSLNVTYTYDAKGQLVSLTDWDSQTTQFAYDNVGGHIATTRANGLRSRYAYDAAGRLRSLRHGKGSRTLAQFDYEVDGRGNRTQAREALAHPATSSDTTLAYDDDAILYTGTWADDAPFKVTDGIAASLKLLFFGDQATLTVGTGPNHGIFDVYIGKTLWQTFDGYAASTGTRAISIDLDGNGPHILEIRNRRDKHLYSTGTTLRFQQLVVADMTYDLHTVAYGYDGLSRLSSADYYAGDNLSGDPIREYAYTYDLAGNRLSESIALNGGSPTVTNYTYNAANQITNSGFTYDDNGNLTNDGTGALTWDRANRLLSYGGASYAYNGSGNRVQQTVGMDVTNYLLDLQPGLPVFLSETTGSNVTRYLHGPRGIHAQKDASGSWEWMAQDGLGSVRGMSSNALGVLWAGSPAPYGAYFGEVGTRQSPYLFTGEYTNANTGLVHLRARDYNPALGVFTSRDPFEGSVRRPMSLNGYSWVEGNVPNLTDPSGLSWETDIWEGIRDAIADNLPWELFDNPYRDMFAGGPLLSMPNLDSVGCSTGNRRQRAFDRAIAAPLRYFISTALIEAAPIINNASYWARVSLGWEPLPEGVTRWQAATEAVLGLGDVVTGGGVSNIRSGDPVRMVVGAFQIIGLVEGVRIGHLGYRSFRSNLFSFYREYPSRSIIGGDGPASQFGPTRGRYSGRDFDPLQAGGPIRELYYENVRITNRGIYVVEAHIARFDPAPSNEYMINRLRRIASGEILPEAVDLRYYTHELREYVRYRNVGWRSGQPIDGYDLWNNTHTATLEDYRLREGPGVLYHLDSPE